MAVCNMSWKKRLFILWLLIVAGLPVYYLRPDCDWYYARWGTPEQIVKSRINFDNPLYEDEGVYTRVFVVRPSAETLELLGADSFEIKVQEAQQSFLPLLLRYELPGPYRFWHWHVHGSVDYVDNSVDYEAVPEASQPPVIDSNPATGEVVNGDPTAAFFGEQ